MNFKAAGAFIVLISACLMGFDMGYSKRKRIELLKEFVWSLTEFESLINYIYETIPHICLKISQDCECDIFKRFYKQIGEKLDEKGDDEFKIIWKGAVNGILTNSCLEKKDIQIIEKMSELPVFLDREALLSKIDTIVLEVNKNICDAEKTIKGQCKVYGCTGFCAGVIVVILLI